MANFATHFYFSPRGRTGRRLYWMFGVVPLFLAGAIVGALGRVVRLPPEALLPLFVLVSLIGLWVWICIGSRRLHDLNQSAWWMLLAVALPIGISFIAPAPVVQFFSLAITTLLGSIPGTVGSNSFGADPKARAETSIAEVAVRSNTSLERTREG